MSTSLHGPAPGIAARITTTVTATEDDPGPAPGESLASFVLEGGDGQVLRGPWCGARAPRAGDQALVIRDESGVLWVVGCAPQDLS